MYVCIGIFVDKCQRTSTYHIMAAGPSCTPFPSSYFAAKGEGGYDGGFVVGGGGDWGEESKGASVSRAGRGGGEVRRGEGVTKRGGGGGGGGRCG
jgi:hypothetical protein